MSRNASASHRPRPRIACWRHGPGSPAASARIQPVLRGSFPSNPSKNFHADAATRSWRNKGRSCAFTSRSEHAQSSSVASIDAPAIHDPPNHGGPWIQKSKECATVMLALQLRFVFEVCAACFGLVSSSPERPCDDVRGLDAPLCELDDDAADFLDRPTDQERCVVRRRSVVFLGGDVILARCRMTAIMAKASMTSET